MSKDVALVLSSGGARGLAHIGAIEELEAQGYRIRVEVVTNQPHSTGITLIPT